MINRCIDLYNERPLMYWFETSINTDDEYMMIWRLGRRFVGYLDMPEPRVIDKWNLKYKGFGDIEFIEGVK